MKISKIAVLFLLTSVLWQGARAQWIIDGQQVQTLNLNVSDPQALYTDGSRQMTAPLAFASSLTATSGMLRATVPWAGDSSFFILDDGEEVLRLSSSDGVGFQIGAMILNQAGFFQTSEGTGVDFGEHMLSGGWQIDQVLPYDEALINRGYADARYLRADTPATQSIKFDQSLTATNGALQIYATDNEEHLGYFKSLSFQDGLQFSTAHSAALFFGQNSSDGLLIGPDSIMQLGYNTRIEFETGTLAGGAGEKWHVAEDPTEASGIVSKGYADAHYLRSDVQIDQPLVFTESLTATSGLFRAYFDPNAQYEDFFIVDGDWEAVRLSSTANAAFMVGNTIVSDGAIVMNGCANKIYIEDGNLDGVWTVDNPISAGGIVNRGYADGRYLQRTEGITTNHTFQAGDVLQIQNGLITAINP